MYQESDGDFLIILQLHSVASNVAHIVNAVNLHPLQSGITDIILILKWPHLSDADWVVGADPLRTKSAVVVSTGVRNILRLADEPLVAREAKNVEVFHGNRTVTLFIHRMNPFYQTLFG